MERFKVIKGDVVENPFGDWSDVDKGLYVDGEDILRLFRRYEGQKIKVTIEVINED